ncbi:hypothetical protein RVBP21_0900 [Pseudomonas phage BRkr]|nr:hypothetical protein RVBP21_0900 [Pseudomonas phage BRkr]
MKGLDWALSVESQDGVAQPVDASNVESETEVKDLDQGNLDVDNANAESQPDDVKASTTVDISVEQLEDGQVSGSSGGKTIDAYGVDEMSGAPKRIVISGFDASTNKAAEPSDNKLELVILLQNGVIPEVGINGVTVEDLLTASIIVFEGFQSGKFACEENAKALFHMNAARELIRARLERRQAQGTEGTYEGN